MAVTSAPSQLEEGIYYPDSDGLPLAESDWQRKVLTYAVEALDLYFRDQPQIYVSGNLFVYYQKGNPKAVVAPDVFVVFGVPKGARRYYMLWREGKGPDVVLEITSESTRREDQQSKRALYAALGVAEYLLVDPTGDYLAPRLQGYRLVEQGYVPLRTDTAPDGSLSLHSPRLGLDLQLRGDEFRFFDPRSRRRLPSLAEAQAQAEQAQVQAEQEARRAARPRRGPSRKAAARRAAEAELERLRAELARLRGEASDD
ncbi:MAG: Uma2 family endonuclease [Ardenticatenaceae bacterium]|nr:Uma2 family endonuclease [Ardenticatenaceae bacterium]